MFRRGQMVPSFDAAAFSMKPGTISQPVKSPFGYHIIQVEAHDPGTKATLANSTDKITAMLRQQQEAPLIQPFLQNLQAKANIQISDPQFADLFPSPPPGAASPAASAAAPAATATP
jgi:peptidyl-prolyl cis-trans isomerase C